MNLLFTNPDTWLGGYFELALELGATADAHAEERIKSALAQIWQHATLEGCYLEMNVEPTKQNRVRVEAIDSYWRAQGIAHIPDVGQCACRVLVIREDQGSDWLTLAIPMGALASILPVGAYPFNDGSDLSWRQQVNTWLMQVGQFCYKKVPFQLGLVGHEVSGDVYAATIQREGIPTHRWIGYLWPVQEELQWFAPNQGSPFSSNDIDIRTTS